MAILFVKFRKLIEVVVADSVATFDGVQLLTTGSEVKALQNKVSLRTRC